MKYKITRRKHMTLSEYAESNKWSLEVRQVRDDRWQAFAGRVCGDSKVFINDAILSLCDKLSSNDVCVVPGTDLEGVEQ